MDLSPYVEHLRADLAAAAEALGPEAVALTERLHVALDPAIRLALLEALSHAASEITAELPTGTVDVRLRGREPELVVDVPSGPAVPVAPTPPVPPEPPTTDEDDGVARISLRLPESVKNRAEELAGRHGQSLNSWIVGILRAATSRGGIEVDIDLSSIPFPGDRGRPGRRMSGWI